MKKLKYSSPFYSRDYFSKNILPNSVYAGRKSIRQQIPFKQHDELELLLVRRGEGTVTVNAAQFPIRRGDMFCFSPCHFHKIDVDRSGALEVSECHINSGLYFYITACPYFQSTPDADLPYPPLHVRLDEPDTRRTELLIDDIAAESEKTDVRDNQQCFFLLMKLFGIMERTAEKNES